MYVLRKCADPLRWVNLYNWGETTIWNWFSTRPQLLTTVRDQCQDERQRIILNWQPTRPFRALALGPRKTLKLFQCNLFKSNCDTWLMTLDNIRSIFLQLYVSRWGATLEDEARHRNLIFKMKAFARPDGSSFGSSDLVSSTLLS